MAGLSTHVLDVARGLPAAEVEITVERLPQGIARDPSVLGAHTTNHDGRVADLLNGAPLQAGVYRLRFATGRYFSAMNITSFYPEISVLFEVTDAQRHHHVPILLSPFGYSTYRGS